MFEYRIAKQEDLEFLWDYDINRHHGKEQERWKKWKTQYLEYNKNGESVTFVVLNNGEPIGQITLLLSPNCSAVKDRIMLCDGKNIANLNSFRIKKEYEGQGHISKLVKMAEQYAKKMGLSYLTIGSEAKESRNLAIYLHFGYTEFVTSFVEDDELILFYVKNI